MPHPAPLARPWPDPSRELTTAELVPGRPFPARTHLTGTITTVFGSLQPRDDEAAEPRQRVTLVTTLVPPAHSGYAPPTDGRAAKTSVVVSFFSKTRDEDALRGVTAEMRQVVAKQVLLQVDGGVLTGVDAGKVYIRLDGERMLKREKGGVIVLLPAPEWFAKPAPPAGPSRLHAKLTDTAILSSRLPRPVSDYAPTAGLARSRSSEGPKRPLSPPADSSPRKESRFRPPTPKTTHELAPTGRVSSSAHLSSPPPRPSFLPNSLDPDIDSIHSSSFASGAIPPSATHRTPSALEDARRQLEELRRQEADAEAELALQQEPMEEEEDPAEAEELRQLQETIARQQELLRVKTENLRAAKELAARRRSTGVLTPAREEPGRARASLPARVFESPITPASSRLASHDSPSTPLGRSRPVTPAPSARELAESRARDQRAAEHAGAEAAREDTARDLAQLTRPATFILQGVSRKYECLGAVSMGRGKHVMGVVRQVQDAKRARGGDCILTVALTDPTLNHGVDNSSEDFLVTIFRPTPGELPQQVQPGWPMLFRNVMINQYNNKPKGQSFSKDIGADFAWIDAAGKVHYSTPLHGGPPMLLGRDEASRLAALGAWWRGVGGAVHPPPAEGGKRGFTELRDVRPGLFFNCVFKILHVAPGSNGRLEIYITDGTSSSSRPRNFHGVSIPGADGSAAVFCLAVLSPLLPEEKPLFAPDKFIAMRNVNAKDYKGELELKWSELTTAEQLEKGWNRRRVTEVDTGDERAKMIEKRIKALKRGEEIPAAPPSPPPAAVVSAAAPAPIRTTFRDPVLHPRTPLADVSANRTIPNRFITHARVRSLHPKNGGGRSGAPTGYIVRHCDHCKRTFTDAFCQSCNDHRLARASWRYRFIALLDEDAAAGGGLGAGGVKPDPLPVLIADDDAAAFLPALPPVKDTTGRPNDAAAERKRLLEVEREVERRMMGGLMDGERTRPVVQWSVESYLAGKGRGKGRKSGEGQEGKGEVLVYRVCGMEVV